MGGRAVQSSLQDVGFGVPADVAIVETARPGLRPYRVVLAQSAWNVVPVGDFWQLCRRYPARMRARMIVRRLVARVNMRRAGAVVCLTASMGDMCRESGLIRVRVVPCTLPTAFAVLPLPGKPEPGLVVVPGTITWYKRPWLALDVAAALSADHGDVRVLYVGDSDGSGCWEHTRAMADRRGIPVSLTRVDSDGMREVLRRSGVVVLPSQLESLGFSLGEALMTATQVVAAPIPAHREVATRIGRQPQWLGETVDPDLLDDERAAPDLMRIVDEWRSLGAALSRSGRP